MPTGGLPDQFRPAPWLDESDGALRDTFARLGVRPVPEPPPPERNPILVGALMGLVVAVAAIGAYVGVTFMTRPAGMVASDPRAEQATADASAAPAPPSAAVPAAASAPAVVASPSFAPIAPAAAAQAPTPTVREEDSPANLAARIANAAPTATRNVQSTAQGVTDTEIRFGMAAPFSGPAKEMGRQLKLGIETAFAAINDSGGIDGRQLKLVTADDGYEPTRTLGAMKQLYEKDQVFGFVDNYGSPTALVSIPYALEHHALYFGAFTGAPSLRHDPPDRYVFNYRAGYAEEADAIVRYLVRVKGLRPEQIGVLTQQDAYGDAGMDGVAKAIRALRGGVNGQIFRMSYNRNTVNVDDAVAQLRKLKVPLKAVVLVATFRPAAKFIEKTRDLYPDMIYATISGVGSTGLADELMLLGAKYANGVICTQVTPAVDSYASVALAYKNALAKYAPGEAPDYVSLEAYLTANILIEGLKRAGPQLDTETVVDKLENMRNFEMGLGPRVNFGPSEHQAVHKVWGTQLDETGHYRAIELE
ncbi:MAG TPA: ABC transporter substrate-binding protein [Bradyrhizobium sp.]|nr:ABC transporter substrate-binding protein [Bradyrhizobium sp.]